MAFLTHADSKSGLAHLWQKLGQVSGAALMLLLVRVGSAGIGILLHVMIARFYGADVLGNLFLALGLAAVFSTILTIGYPWIIAPVVSRSESEADPGLLRSFISTALKELTTVSFLLCIPVAILIWYLPNITVELRSALLIAVATAPVYAVMRLNGGLANARKRFVIANAPELLVRPVAVAIFVGLSLLLSIEINATIIVAFNLAIATVLMVLVAVLMSRQSRANITGAKKNATIDRKQKRQWRNLAMPMVLATLFVNLFADLDILMIGTILPVNETGIFGVCLKITFLMAFAVQIVHQVMLRDASDAHLLDDPVALQATVRTANRFAISITMCAFIFLILFGSHVLNVFGPEFSNGYVAMIGLMFAQLIRALAGPAIQMLMISGNQRLSIPVYVASLGMLLACNLLLVPFYGLIGAAVAVVCTTLYLSLSLDRIVRHKVGISVSIFS